MDTKQIITLEEALNIGGLLIFDATSLDRQFKLFIQNHFKTLCRYGREQYAILKCEYEKVKADMLPALDLLISRNMFSFYDACPSIGEFLLSMKNGLKKTKVFLIVNDRQRRNFLIGEAKTAGIFVNFYRIDDNGNFVPFETKREHAPVNGPSRKARQLEKGTRKEETERFHIKSMPEQIGIQRLPARARVEINSTVFDSNGNGFVLVSKEMINNGACSYRTNNYGIWAKIFNDSGLNTFLQAKIERMLSIKIEFEGLCWPVDIIKDIDGVFRGYLFKEPSGQPLQLCIFKKAGIVQSFPGWNKLDLCGLAETILKKVHYLHSKNILMGCINPASIRVVDQRHVFFVDTDNYQIEGFPCLVHNISFTPPELMGKKVYLATKQNENFAVAELAFMLLMPGKSPYAVTGDQAPSTVIQKMQFPYSNGQLHGLYALPGMWRFMWSHLSPLLKAMFYYTFQKGEKYNSEDDRKYVGSWINAIEKYEEDLKNPTDPESLKIYPKTFKRTNNDIFYRCSYCGTEHPQFYFNKSYFDHFKICNGCLDKQSDVSFTCRICNKTYYYTNRTALFHKVKKMQDSEWKDQKYCRDCKNKKLPCQDCGKEYPFFYLRGHRCPDCNQIYENQPYTTRHCKDCGCSFIITIKEHNYYMKKALNEPVRCKNCRDKRKLHY